MQVTDHGRPLYLFASDLGTITRADGTAQGTYFGHPLYFFAFDQPGQSLGEGAAAFGGTFKLLDLGGTPSARVR